MIMAFTERQLRILHSGWEEQNQVDASVGEGPLLAQPSPGKAFSETRLRLSFPFLNHKKSAPSLQINTKMGINVFNPSYFHHPQIANGNAVSVHPNVFYTYVWFLKQI